MIGRVLLLLVGVNPGSGLHFDLKVLERHAPLNHLSVHIAMPPTRSHARPASGSNSQRISVRRTATDSASGKPSIRLTVKAPPSKLRQALNSSDGDTPEPPVRNARSTRNPRTVVEADSDEDMADTGGFDDDDENDGEEDDDMDMDGEEDAQGDEDEEDDGDDDTEDNISMADHPPPPVFKANVKAPAPGTKKPQVNITVSVPSEGTLKSVEAKEADMEDSDLGSDELDDDDDDEHDGLSDSDSEGGGSGSATPDLTKLTRRQRATFEEGLDVGLLALSNEAQKKKELTAEEHQSRRAEMARRRKNLSEKRNEEEKMDTINKLLKKPAPKRRTRAEMLAAAAAADTPAGEDDEESAYPLYTRWVNDSSGSRLGVPTAWLEGQVGAGLAQGWTKPPETKLVEEV